MKKELLALAVLVAAFFILVFAVPLRLAAPPETPREEAGDDYAATAMLSAALNTEGKTLGVSVTPLEVLEDSRCPVGVTCIQAGTVRLKVRLKSALAESTVVMSLGDSISTATEKVEFIDAEPPPYAGAAIPSADYIFNFKISRAVGGEF